MQKVLFWLFCYHLIPTKLYKKFRKPIQYRYVNWCHVEYDWDANKDALNDSKTYLSRRKKVALCVRNLAH